jgi:dienelactone hydrolase
MMNPVSEPPKSPIVTPSTPSPQAALPDALTFADGTRVATASDWTKRRAELLELFRKHVYGRAPVGKPDTLRFRVHDVTPGMMDGKATRKQVTISYAGPGGEESFNLLLFIPTEGVTMPPPVFLLLCNRGATNIDPTRKTQSPFWPAEEIVARGYAAAAIELSDVAPDRADGHTAGVHKVFPYTGNPNEAWGTIAAWAWAASRVLDYLETDRDVNAKQVAVVGHSRGGKAALWAGAQDERFAFVVSNNSGSTGAALARNKNGERVANITKTFPHWFCKNYNTFAGREEALPVDQHQLLALMAPRPIYVASASEDTWADPKAEFQACTLAAPVYALWGKPGFVSNGFPGVQSPLHSGTIGYHLRQGKHDLTRYDWEQFMNFYQSRLGKP